MFHLLVAAAVGLASFASAQDSPPPYKYSIDPNSVPIQTRGQWCLAQNTVCTQVCTLGTRAGTPFCDPTTLDYGCTCRGRPTPDLTKYNNTIPFFECLEYVAQCQVANTDNPHQQQICLNIQCGGRDASDAATTTTASMPTPTGGSGGGNGGSGQGGSGNGNGGGNSGGGGNNGGGDNSGGNANGGNNNGGGGGGGGAASGLNLHESYTLATLIGTGMVVFGAGIGL